MPATGATARYAREGGVGRLVLDRPPVNVLDLTTIVLGGGIAPKIVAKLKEPGFINAFTAKGRLSPLLRDIPVRVIMNPKTALLGAARHAALGLGD